MSLGLSKMSRKGGVSLSGEGGTARASGAEAATEASLERKGSLGFRGGIGGSAILVVLNARLGAAEVGEEEEKEEEAGTAMGIWGQTVR